MFRGPVSALTVLAMPLALPAAADITYRNDSGGSIAYYGHISPAVTSVDDGVARENSFADNAHSKSRLGFIAHQEFDHGRWSCRIGVLICLAGCKKLFQFAPVAAVPGRRPELLQQFHRPHGHSVSRFP